MTAPAPERVLRLSLIGWGLGELSMGRSRAGFAWLALEIITLAAVVATTLLWADTTWYLLPFLLGVAFLVLWTAQAVMAYRRARSQLAASPEARPRSPVATIAWLTLPLLAWGTGFWLIAAHAASPAGVMDGFVTRWAELEPLEPPGAVFSTLSGDPFAREAALALGRLQELCDQGMLPSGCDASTKNLLRDVRVSISTTDETHATATAELVRYERFPSRFLGIFQGADLRPIPVATVLTLAMEAQPAALGARRWSIVNADAGR